MPYANIEDDRERQRRSRKNNPTLHARANKKYTAKLKLKVVLHYCGGKICCQCPGCRTSHICFLQVDHKDGKGHKHKEGSKWKMTAKKLWLWLIRNNFPEGFQILCTNCNFAKRCKLSCPMAGVKH